MVNESVYKHLIHELGSVKLIAVSKTKPISDVQALYNLGQLAFGENKVQEMCAKQEVLPKNIQWHLIGHLQKNKVKYIAPFVHCIHSVDSIELADEINKHAMKQNRVISILFQIRIASEETKYGIPVDGVYSFLDQFVKKEYAHLKPSGLMGMASFTDDTQQISKEFDLLHHLFIDIKQKTEGLFDSFSDLSMGMSGDFKLAIANGSTMVRVGSLLFGERKKPED